MCHVASGDRKEEIRRMTDKALTRSGRIYKCNPIAEVSAEMEGENADSNVNVQRVTSSQGSSSANSQGEGEPSSIESSSSGGDKGSSSAVLDTSLKVFSFEGRHFTADRLRKLLEQEERSSPVTNSAQGDSHIIDPELFIHGLGNRVGRGEPPVQQPS